MKGFGISVSLEPMVRLVITSQTVRPCGVGAGAPHAPLLELLANGDRPWRNPDLETSNSGGVGCQNMMLRYLFVMYLSHDSRGSWHFWSAETSWIAQTGPSKVEWFSEACTYGFHTQEISTHFTSAHFGTEQTQLFDVFLGSIHIPKYSYRTMTLFSLKTK